MIVDFIEDEQGNKFIRAESIIEWINEVDESELCDG